MAPIFVCYGSSWTQSLGCERGIRRLSTAYKYLSPSDLHQGNTLFRIPDFDSWIIEQVYEHFGELRQVDIKREDIKPLAPAVLQYAVRPPNLRELLQLCFTEECTV